MVCREWGREMKGRFVRRAGVEAADGVDMGPVETLNSREN